MLTPYDPFKHVQVASEPPSIAKVGDTGAVPLMTYSRFMDLPKDIRFMVYEYLLYRRIRPMAYPDQGIAYEVITIDPAIAQASRQLRDEARVATRQQRLGGPLVLYMMNAFSFVGDLSRTLSKAYVSDQRRILRQGIDAPAFERASVAESSLTIPTIMLSRVFRNAARNRNFQGYQTFDLERSKSPIRDFFEFATVKLRHSTHVECRFLVYGGRWNSVTFENHRARSLHNNIDWRGEIQCNVVLVADCQATQESLSRTKLPLADHSPMELATFEEREYMRTMISRWMSKDCPIL
jgi:hypothetical protein